MIEKERSEGNNCWMRVGKVARLWFDSSIHSLRESLGVLFCSSLWCAYVVDRKRFVLLHEEPCIYVLLLKRSLSVLNPEKWERELTMRMELGSKIKRWLAVKSSLNCKCCDRMNCDASFPVHSRCVHQLLCFLIAIFYVRMRTVRKNAGCWLSANTYSLRLFVPLWNPTVINTNCSMYDIFLCCPTKKMRLFAQHNLRSHSPGARASHPPRYLERKTAPFVCRSEYEFNPNYVA